LDEFRRWLFGTMRQIGRWASRRPTHNRFYITNDVFEDCHDQFFHVRSRPDTMTVSNLFLSAPVGVTNTLDMSSAGTNKPLVIFGYIQHFHWWLPVADELGVVGAGIITNLNTNAVLAVTNSFFSVDGSIILNSNGRADR